MHSVRAHLDQNCLTSGQKKKSKEVQGNHPHSRGTLPGLQTAALCLHRSWAASLGHCSGKQSSSCSPILPTVCDTTHPHPQLFFSRMRNSHAWNPLATKTFQPAIAFASLPWAFKVHYCFHKTWNLHCWTCSCAVNYDISKQLTQKWESSQGPLLHPEARGENPQHKPEHGDQTMSKALRPQKGCDETWRANTWARWLLLLHHVPGPWHPGYHPVKLMVFPGASHYTWQHHFMFSDKKY